MREAHLEEIHYKSVGVVAAGFDHPSEQELQRFLRGELPRAEVRKIVRHLLAGCPACGQELSRWWHPEALGRPELRIVRK